MYAVLNRTTRNYQIYSMSHVSSIRSLILDYWRTLVFVEQVRRPRHLHFYSLEKRVLPSSCVRSIRSTVSWDNLILSKIVFHVSSNRYKIIDCVRSHLPPQGPCNKESAAYICQTMNIEQDVVYGQTKLFIKQPWVILKRFSDGFICHLLGNLCSNWNWNVEKVSKQSLWSCKK